MAVTYISLMNFTDQGLRAIKDTTKRAEAARKLAQEYGVTFKSLRWTQGQYDIVAELEAKDEQSYNSFAVALMAQGFVRGQSLRAYGADEMNAMLSRLP
ncbi:MAG TPA: GYD domain-containing protein [Burkholderiaceae bacterium]|nr:GYD domain-containing protein [Burkholderiaceae bacterium]